MLKYLLKCESEFNNERKDEHFQKGRLNCTTQRKPMLKALFSKKQLDQWAGVKWLLLEYGRSN